MHHLIIPIEQKYFFCATIRSNPLYHFQGGKTIRHTHGSTTSRVAQPYTTLMAGPLPGWHNHTPHSWQDHFQGGTTIRHTHGSTTSRVAQPYATLMAGPLPGWHNHMPHSWQDHFQGGTTIRHTHGSTTGYHIFSSADSSKCSTSIALSGRICSDLHWEVRKWKGLDQGAIIPSSITATISPNKLLGQLDPVDRNFSGSRPSPVKDEGIRDGHIKEKVIYISIELSAFDPTVIISSGLITFIHSCHAFVVGRDSKGAAYFLFTAISLSSGHRCDALRITVGVHDHDDLSVLPCTCTDFPGLLG